jgi:hypothetical protein
VSSDCCVFNAKRSCFSSLVFGVSVWFKGVAVRARGFLDLTSGVSLASDSESDSTIGVVLLSERRGRLLPVISPFGLVTHLLLDDDLAQVVGVEVCSRCGGCFGRIDLCGCSALAGMTCIFCCGTCAVLFAVGSCSVVTCASNVFLRSSAGDDWIRCLSTIVLPAMSLLACRLPSVALLAKVLKSIL